MGWLWAGNPLGQPWGPGSWALELSPPGIDALKEKALTCQASRRPKPRLKVG